MEETQRWSATYTNHVKQKRKVYHDGFLVLQSSRNKVFTFFFFLPCIQLMYTAARSFSSVTNLLSLHIIW